jgi:LysM repeat protein
VQPEQQTEQPTQAPEPTAAPDVQPTQAPEAQAQPTTAPAPSGSVNTGVAPVIFQDYVVQGNDTLYNITRQLETSITLMAIHGIDQDDLVVGITLKIPIGNPAYCPSLRPYAVGEGDTVFAIATRRNTTVENIRTINQLNAEYDIQAGEVLCVP